MPNFYRIFRDLIPEPPLLVGVVTVAGSEVCQVTLIDGGILTARGDATLGARVFVRDGVIEGAAPTLPVELIEV